MKTLVRWIGIWFVVAGLLGAHVAACAADLDISSSQKDQLKALASNTRDRTSRERDALRQARADLVKVYSSYKIDYGKLKSIWEKTTNAQLSLLNIHLDNEVAIRDILKKEQFKALRDMMKRRLRDRDVLVVAPPEMDILDRLPDKHMLDELGVSDDKQKQLQNHSGHEKAIQALRESSKQLLELYSGYELDSAAARKLITSLHQRQGLLLRQQNYRQRQIRKVLTQDQFQKLQQEIAKKMADRSWKTAPKWNHHSHPKQD